MCQGVKREVRNYSDIARDPRLDASSRGEGWSELRYRPRAFVAYVAHFAQDSLIRTGPFAAIVPRTTMLRVVGSFQARSGALQMHAESYLENYVKETARHAPEPSRSGRRVEGCMST